MALPQAIQQQLDQADAIVAQINGETPNGEAPENTAEPPASEPPKTDPPAQVTQPVEEPWEQRYRTLRGMYDADVPRLHAQTKELSTQVQTLVNELETLRAESTVKREKASITDEDRETFGPDLVNLIERAAEAKVETLRQREAQLVDQIEQLKNQLGEVSTRQGVSDKERFLAGLTAQVPGWEAVNVAPGFLAWLAEVDPIYGLPRKVALDNAYGVFDVARVAAVFKAYMGTQPETKSSPGPNKDLLRQVPPSTSRTSQAPADKGSGRIYTNADIEQFYAAHRRGEFTDEEAGRIEQDIHAAIAEGRIR